MPYQGVPSSPLVTFASSDYAYYVRDVPVKRRGENYLRIYLIPTDYLKWRYNIEDRHLNFHIDSQGVLVREYPEELVEFYSRNPENIIVHIHCNFDGTEVMGSKLTELRQKLQRYSSRNRTLLAELENLREEMKSLSEQLRMLRRRGTDVE